MSQLDEIEARVNEAEAKRAQSRRNPDPIFDAGMMLAIQASSADVPYLLALVREQAAKLDKVAALAEAWRYKGEFGWGAWQEGQGPDPEGYVLDTCAGEIRAALEARA